MAITKKTLKNNVSLSNNVSKMQSIFPDTRALVVDGYVAGLEQIAVKDYYHVVILETDDALPSVPVPDYLVLSDNSPYRNSVFFIDKYFNNTDTIFILNYDAIRVYKKLKRKLDMFNINYLPVGNNSTSITPAKISLTNSGLNALEPGVHMAKILGCTEIYYTGVSENATRVNLGDIQEFTTRKNPNQPLLLQNFISEGRATVLNTSF